MDTLTLDELRSLTSISGGTLVSIYLPTAPFSPGSQTGNASRLKSVLRRAEDLLASTGLRAARIDAVLEPARQLTDSRPFWLRATAGLALFLGDGLRTYRLPEAPPELVFVGERFHIKPLISLLEARRHAYVLALSQKRVRLLRMTRDDLAEIDLTGAPTSLAEALRWDNYEKRSLQFHTQTSSGSGGRRPAVFHGSGEPDPKEEIARYFRGIDHALAELLAGDDAPLVLAGVDYHIPLYREVSSLPQLAPDAVAGSPDAIGDVALHERAWAIAAARFEAERAEVIGRIDELWATPRTTADPETLVMSALHGRVDTLFVALDRQVWGWVDRSRDTIRVHARPEPGDEDLLNTAALETLLAGGDTYALPATEMPRDVAAVALLRY